jgi:thioredoxin-dependent peroxiredoxin
VNAPQFLPRRRFRRFVQGFLGLLLIGVTSLLLGDLFMSRVNVGEQAPDFQFVTADGAPKKLSDYRHQQIVVVYFYPRDNTSICTAQACSFRDAYEQFTDLGAVVIGVSSDSEQRHDGFAQKHRLPFILASDGGGVIRKSFGVPKTFGFLPGRVTYVIDKQGIVRHIFNSQWSASGHVPEALRVIKELKAQESPSDMRT